MLALRTLVPRVAALLRPRASQCTLTANTPIMAFGSASAKTPIKKYKLKRHKGAVKRFRVLKNGLVKR